MLITSQSEEIAQHRCKTGSMTAVQACPSCGETEALRGASVGGGIEITCQACAYQWTRGDLRCRSCAGQETVMIPQVIARTTRGNQLSIMGHRDTVLCPVCDAEVIAQCQTARQWVPEDYVSAFSYDPAEGERVREQQVSTPAAPLTPTAARTAPAPRQAAQEPAAPEPTRQPPTVRQAIAEYMAAEPQADALAMLSLGTFLKSGTRLETLSGPKVATSLQAWFSATWGDHSADRRAAVQQAVTGAFAHWVDQGWIADDPSEGLDS